MKKVVLIIVLSLLFSLPETGYPDQWKLFEHRYPYKPEDVINASKFIKKRGYWEAYINNRLAGYVFLSKDWTKKVVGYSGKHLETLIGMDTNGTITGVKLIFHSEPIVLIGLKEDHYLDYIKQYRGKNIKSPLSVGREISMDAITGATVTAVVQNSIILETSRKVADAAGLTKAAVSRGRKILQKYSEMTWDELRKTGAVKNIVVTSEELGLEGDEIYLDLAVAVVTPPSVGRSLLGDALYSDTISRLKDGGSAVAIFSRGKGSFKGTGFVRGGVFDRFNIEQGAKVHMLTDRDYRVLSDLKAKGSPQIREGGIFIVRDEEFDPTEPFKLNLILPYRSSAAKKEFRSYAMEYVIPERFLE